MRVLWVAVLVACSTAPGVESDAGTDAGFDAGNGGLVEPREFCEHRQLMDCEQFHRCHPNKAAITAEDRPVFGESVVECVGLQASAGACDTFGASPTGCAPPDDYLSRYYRCSVWFGGIECAGEPQSSECGVKTCP